MKRFRQAVGRIEKFFILFRSYAWARWLLGGKWELVCFDKGMTMAGKSREYRAWMWVHDWHPNPDKVMNTAFEKREEYAQ